MVVVSASAEAPGARRAPVTAAQLHLTRRRFWNRAVWAGCVLALALVVTPVVWIVAGILAKALPHWHWGTLTTTSTANGGGLLNAVVGTFVIVGGVAVIGGAIGICGGIHLAEYTAEGKGGILRGASEVLSGVPSIVMGYVGYLALVVGLFKWGFSLAAALVVLSILVIPYITKSTEVAIRNVPTAYREGAEALGMRSGYALRKVVLRPALPGIATGVIVAMAIALGETAPLLYTAEWSNTLPKAQLTHSPVGYLTYPVYQVVNTTQPSVVQWAYSAALLLIVLVILLIVVARVIVSRTQRHAPERQHAAR
ncbi:MAG TPA: phosphate ABC transporter permease PstA [Acidimicrobiales bacterium]|nr:phosphate ABC transporter permease PstA [Acidimicrobiales bacterium]